MKMTLNMKKMCLDSELEPLSYWIPRKVISIQEKYKKEKHSKITSKMKYPQLNKTNKQVICHLKSMVMDSG